MSTITCQDIQNMIIRYNAAKAFYASSRQAASLPHFLSNQLQRGQFVHTHGFATSNSKIAIQEPTRVQPGFFYTNTLLNKAQLKSDEKRQSLSAGPVIARQKAVTQNLRADLPQRRQYARVDGTSPASRIADPNTSAISNALTSPLNSCRQLIPILLALSKPRLTILVVLTACASYSLYPVPDLLTPTSTSTPSLSPLTLIFLTSGTTLCAASANALNMLYEPKGDALMSRTRNRPLVRGLITTRGAAIYAVLAGMAGTAALYYGVNSTVSFLGVLNIALYAGVYTPLKKISVLNTWVGAIVGGLPPLMGWAAAAGQSATEGGRKELLLGEWNIGGWLLAALVLAWQFPHFMSLSWSIREEYKKAGYKMLSWVNPARNSRVALRYSLLIFPICAGLCYCGVTEWSFVVASAPINAWLLREAVRFWRYQGAKGSARSLFWASVWHLPVVMILAMVEKKGMWQRIWRAVSIEIDDEEDWEDEDLQAADRKIVAVIPTT